MGELVNSLALWFSNLPALSTFLFVVSAIAIFVAIVLAAKAIYRGVSLLRRWMVHKQIPHDPDSTFGQEIPPVEYESTQEPNIDTDDNRAK